MTLQKAIIGHNPAGVYINDGWYALEAAIRYNLTVDEAIYRITGIHLNNTVIKKRPKRGLIKQKIMELHKNFPDKSPKEIALKIACSEEMVKYTIRKLETDKNNKNKSHTISKSKEKRINKQDSVINILQNQPSKTIPEIANQTGLKYGTVLRYVKKYYMSLQLELPFEY